MLSTGQLHTSNEQRAGGMAGFSMSRVPGLLGTTSLTGRLQLVLQGGRENLLIACREML